MKKRVLVLCTGNSCRSIMAEALLNAKLGRCLEAESSGVEASGRVNPHARALLVSKGIWKDTYRSKVIDEVKAKPFDLVVTVCEHARESCPVFPNAVNTVHIGFEDPSGKAPEAYVETYHLIEKELLPLVESMLCSEEKVKYGKDGQ